MLKNPVGWRATQIWSEVIAYRLGVLVGVDVPPCHVAVENDTGQTGALVQFFYEFPKQTQTTRLIHGADLLNFVRISPTVGVRPHDVVTNIRAHRVLRLRNSTEWWAKTICFDALIGNTDRHTENWGAIQITEGESFKYDYAPLYDNGTSLGYQQKEDKLVDFWRDPQKLSDFVDRGTHDCGFSPLDDGPMPHLTLCKKLLDEFPDTRFAMRDVIRFSRSQVDQIVNECVAFRVPDRFTPERAIFVADQIEMRRRKLAELIGE